MFAERYEVILKQVIPLENGLPSKDTIRRMMQVIHPDVLNEVSTLWTGLLAESNRQATGKLIAVDGKTMCGNHQNETKSLHIVSAYSVEDGICFGQTVTIDAMGTQVEIAKQIRKQKADYVLAVKGNQGLLHDEIKTYLDDALSEKQIKATENGYIKTIESARSQIETREYYQTEVIDWMVEKNRWKGLKSIGKVVTTVEKNGQRTQEIRYYISSLAVEATRFKRAVRGHWGIESLHWHLDVTFGEDANHTLNQTAARNLNIIRKLAIPMLKELSLKNKTIYHLT